jgi:hypothetical protein
MLTEGGGVRPEEAILRGSVVSAAAAVHLGDAFQYLVEEPVTLPRQKSALIPIVTQEVGGRRVSIFNAGVHPKHPLLGLKFVNATKLHLAQGPVTVFDGPNYAGDARLPDLKPGETRLVSYAIDLGTEVESRANRAPEVLQTVHLAHGVLVATSRQRRTTTYTIKNRSELPRTVIVEHPHHTEWDLVKPEKSAERTRTEHRFEVAAGPNTPITLEVVEERDLAESRSITSPGEDVVALFVKSPRLSEPVKAALQKALELRTKWQDTQRELTAEEKALAAFIKDQDRMRANLARLPKEAEAYKRYVKKFDEQEPEIEAHQKRLVQLQATAEERLKAFEEYVRGLTVE